MVDKLFMEKYFYPVPLSSLASVTPPMLLNNFRLDTAVTAMSSKGRTGNCAQTIALPEILASLDRNVV